MVTPFLSKSGRHTQDNPGNRKVLVNLRPVNTGTQTNYLTPP